MTDTLDTVLSQAVVCAYAVPGAGAVVAAGISIVQAIIDSVRPPEKPQTDYSFAEALVDLGRRIEEDLRTDARLIDVKTVKGWKVDLRNAKQTTPSMAVVNTTAFLANDFQTTFAGLSDLDDGSPGLGKSLGTYFLARTTYHALCSVWMDKLLEADRLNIDPHTDYRSYYEQVRVLYLDSLSDAAEDVGPAVDALDDYYLNARARADAAGPDAVGSEARKAYVSIAGFVYPPAESGAAADWYAHRAAATAVLRGARVKARVQGMTYSDVLAFREVLAAYALTKATLTAYTSTSATSASSTPTTSSAPTQQVGSDATASGLGPRRPGTVRFLREVDPAGRPIDIVADSPVSPGGLAVQDAGSADPQHYFRFDAATDTIAARLRDSGQLSLANHALAAAYDDVHGEGAHTADAAASPTDRHTTLAVALAGSTPPIGDSVYAILYSVAPKPGTTGIRDAYRDTYTDAFEAVADWNIRHPTIANVRLTLLPSEVLGGAAGDAGRRAQAAGLVIDAAVAAMTSHPLTLATLTLLVPAGGTVAGADDVWTAFAAAAAARHIATTPQGFDVPLS